MKPALVLALTALLALPAAAATPRAADALVLACDALPGLEHTFDSDVVFFGDYHGTNEPPSLFYDAVCGTAATHRGQRLLVALELPDEFNAYFRGAESADNYPAVLAGMKGSTFWDVFGDGRRSAAMLRMVEKLMALSRDHDGKLRLVAIQRPRIDSEGADFLLGQMAGFGADHTLVFVGNAHSRKQNMPNYPVAPLARNVAAAGPSVLSIDIAPIAGEAWFCMPQCGRKPLPPRPEGAERGIVLQACDNDCPHDGFYVIPVLSVSHAVRR